MCFRPPIIEGDEMKCPMCGATVPIGVVTCPNCGATQADAAAAAPRIPTPPAPGAKPKAPGVPSAAQPKKASAPAAPTGAQHPATALSKMPAAGGSTVRATASGPIIISEVGAFPDVWVPDHVPQIGGQIPLPSMPEAPGFEEAPDISGTGNYFTSGTYNNG